MIRRACLAILLTCAAAIGQTIPAPTPTTPSKPLAFDVVSIRPSQPGGNGTVNTMNETAGYRLVSQPFWLTIMAAYFPQGGAYWSKDRLSNAPSWIDNLYDINAKISRADLPEWQKQGTGADKTPMLRMMLQTMLADRCQLVAHFAPGVPINGFALEIGKRAPHLTQSKPSEN